MHPGKLRCLAAVGVAYVLEYNDRTPPDRLDALESTLNLFLDGAVSRTDAAIAFETLIGSAKPLDRIVTILQTPPTPIPDFFVESHLSNPPGRKSRSWTEYEDQRLLAGIHHFGIDDWQAVASFVGNGRTRAQCSQRWIRGLDPRISKDHWTAADISKLQHLVEIYGAKNWTKIAGEMGNRSDVQCRYRYKQLKQGRGDSAKSISQSISMPSQLHVRIDASRNAGEKVPFPSIESLLNGRSGCRQSGSMPALPRVGPGGG
jgi:hypothetical protein